MMNWQKQEAFNTMLKITEVVEQVTVGENTAQLRINTQELSDPKYRTHYLVVDGEWDGLKYRNRQTAQGAFDGMVAFWTPAEEVCS